ncbi:MAG: FAD-dependent oxidoreductase, partial [Betaproteobacteria bacterium]
MSAQLFTPERKLTPYWWDATPRPTLAATQLPESVDVLVIGSGYTGLHAALQVARGGRSTLVVDAEDAGWGCSTRNGGQISTSIKPGYDELSARHGAQVAQAIHAEGQRSLQWIGEFIATENIDCSFGVVGRFHAAHNAQQFAALAQRIAQQPKGLAVDTELIPRAEQHRELGTDVYHGGVVYRRHAALDPGRYHQGLLERVIAAGATVVARCPVSAIARDHGRFRAQTPLGDITARDVVIATNGYTVKLTPWLRRRVIPIGSYII